MNKEESFSIAYGVFSENIIYRVHTSCFCVKVVLYARVSHRNYMTGGPQPLGLGLRSKAHINQGIEGPGKKDAAQPWARPVSRSAPAPVVVIFANATYSTMILSLSKKKTLFHYESSSVSLSQELHSFSQWHVVVYLTMPCMTIR